MGMNVTLNFDDMLVLAYIWLCIYKTVWHIRVIECAKFAQIECLSIVRAYPYVLAHMAGWLPLCI